MTTQSDVMGELARRLGMETLQPDSAGLYTLLVDGNLPVFLQAVGDEGLILFAGIGSLPTASAGDACRALLEANHFWLGTGGFCLSLAPGTLNVLLTARAEFDDCRGERLFDLFDRFVSAAAAWRQRLPSVVEQSASAALAGVAAASAAEPVGGMMNLA